MLLLLGHVLGDFYLQTKGMAEKKEKNIKWVLFHCLGYLIAMILHFIIDLSKYAYLSVMTKKRKKTQVIERNIFFLDQLLHFL